MNARNVIDLVPMVHVRDVAASIVFYRRFGFEVKNTFEPGGTLAWAWLEHRSARIMFSRASAPVDPEAQAVLFYLYTNDLVALRKKLMEEGIEVGDITRPFYMPEGEARVTDPDGYCLLIGQSDRR